MLDYKFKKIIVAGVMALVLACGSIPSPSPTLTPTGSTAQPTAALQFENIQPSDMPTPVATTDPSLAGATLVGADITNAEGRATLDLRSPAVQLGIQVKDKVSNAPLSQIQIQILHRNNSSELLAVALDPSGKYFPLVKKIQSIQSQADGPGMALGVARVHAQGVEIGLFLVAILPYWTSLKSARELLVDQPDLQQYSFWQADYCFSGKQLKTYLSFVTSVASIIVDKLGPENQTLDDKLLKAIVDISTGTATDDATNYLESLPDHYLIRLNRFPKPIFSSSPGISALSLVGIEIIGRCDTQAVTVAAPQLTGPAVTSTSSSTSIPADVGSTQVSGKDGMVMVYVPAGDFLMGSVDTDPLARSDEKPQHTVSLAAFWIDRTDVTNAMYQLCVNAGACQPPGSISPQSTHSPYFGNSAYDNHPVISATWDDATAYCSWAGRRLPTEAEWEKAARGTDGRLHPWGDDPPTAQLLNYNDNVGGTSDVGNYPGGASPYGALDMAGNVWQWVNDWYDDTYYGSSPAENPAGPTSGSDKVLRGGSSGDGVGDGNLRAASRDRHAPSQGNYVIGFRCALSP